MLPSGSKVKESCPCLFRQSHTQSPKTKHLQLNSISVGSFSFQNVRQYYNKIVQKKAVQIKKKKKISTQGSHQGFIVVAILYFPRLIGGKKLAFPHIIFEDLSSSFVI